MVERSHTAGSPSEIWQSVYGPLMRASERAAEWFAPRSDAADSGERYLINVELPGVAPDDIDVSIDNRNLIVRGEKRVEREELDQSYFFSEREVGAFMRSFRLPPDADIQAIDATFTNGLLSIAVRKLTTPKDATRKVTVRSE